MNAMSRFDNAKRRRTETHERQRMLTPEYVLEPVRSLFGGIIGLDPCTEPDNPTNAQKFYSPPDDGAVLPWDAPTVFVNPPYGEARQRWVVRCIHEGSLRRVVLLIPAHTETRVFQMALTACTSVCLIQARLRFRAVRDNGRHEAASHGSALFGFGLDLRPVGHLGAVLRGGGVE
jgi:hypothetical protein